MRAEQRFQDQARSLRWPEKEGGQDQVDDPKPDIANPALQRRKITPPPRSAQFPRCDQEQAAKDDDGGQRDLFTLSALRLPTGSWAQRERLLW